MQDESVKPSIDETMANLPENPSLAESIKDGSIMRGEQAIFIEQPTEEEYIRLIEAGLVNKQYASHRWLQEHGIKPPYFFNPYGEMYFNIKDYNKLNGYNEFMNKYFPKT